MPDVASPSEPASLADRPALRRRGPGRWPKEPALADTIPFEDALVCWTPLSEAASGFRATAGQVEVMALPDRTGRSEAYACHAGGSEVTDHHLTARKAGVEALRLFNRLVLGDGMRPRVVHEAMIRIREYCLAIDPEIPGARRAQGRRRESNGDDYVA
ncbi:hypothetical protein MKK75_11445 [Methylobacterium sp. J-030]|uniref:hypothetical protein n=1 Tax=Methylobacterium sp. J-030 TaxID=2836627 RepID=UPI001FBB1450|nr:hypothetical protein [Methylobacterium sp. J-030]MCJ2069398.1 hypothetical protein [Methylobacterium sp. J-030]